MREKLIEMLDDALLSVNWDSHDYPDTDSAAEILIANDVVPVVRCKDCKHWMYEYDDVGLCVTDVPDIDGVQRRACDFCSYGERKTDERKID